MIVVFSKRMLFLIFILSCSKLFAIDTLKISYAELEVKFKQNNLDLRSAKYHIEAAKGSLSQAKIWDNPSFSFENSINNPNSSKFIDFSSTGGYSLSLNQNFPVFGRIGSKVDYEESNTKIAELNYFDIERNQLLNLQSSFYNIYFLNKILDSYSENIDSLSKVINSSDEMCKKGIMPYQEILRLKSILLNLENDKDNFKSLQFQNQTTISNLVAYNKEIVIIPEISENLTDKFNIENYSLEDCIKNAIENRSDVKIEEEQVRNNELNLNYQKSLILPDINLGIAFDKNGNYYPDYLALQLNINLPVFNRNQGNIANAENLLESEKIDKQKLNEHVAGEVRNAYTKAYNKQKLIKKFNDQFGENLNKFFSGLIENYKKRNISVIEFSDYFQSYFSSNIQKITLQNDYINSILQLNYVVGKNLYNL